MARYRAGEFMTAAMGGVRGWQNLAAWGVAGTGAYFLWVRPERERRRVLEERARAWRETDAERYAEKVTPRPDPQASGLIVGRKTSPKRDSSVSE